MPVSEAAPARRLACAHAARQCCEDPIGSIVLPDRAVFVELALPWPEQQWTAAHLSAEMREAIEGLERVDRGARCYAIAPDPIYSVPGYTRVLLLHRPAGPFARFERQEWLVPQALAPGLLRALADERAASAVDYQGYRCSQRPIRDLLVCTHGSLDACCGRLGYPFYEQLRQRYAGQAGQSVRVWRVSHFGGHRFAPTMLELPLGLGWAYLTSETLAAVLDRRGPVHELLPYYRGWAGLPGYYLQLADRAALLREGWSWLSYQRTGTLLSGRAESSPVYDQQAEQTAVVRIDYRSPDGSRAGSYQATIEWSGRLLTALRCSGPRLQPIHQYRVLELQELGSSQEQRWASAGAAR